MGWHMSMNAGDVEKGIEVFNNSTNMTSGANTTGIAMGEDLTYNTYYYDGPVYYRGHKIAARSDIYTSAPSKEIATRNILVRVSNKAPDLYNYDIVDSDIEQLPDNPVKMNGYNSSKERCSVCGYQLTDSGDCPVCDYGEDDLLESISSADAIWRLRNIKD
jgi:hypothetical protein